jgi:exosortase
MLFSFFILLSFIVFFEPLTGLLYFSLESPVYSYIPLIPLMSVFLIYSERETIFVNTSHSFIGGGILLVSALMLSVSVGANGLQLPPDYCLTFTSLAVVMFWMGGFISSYGLQAFKNAAFPLFFLVLIVPFPDSALDMVIVALQEGSFKAAYWIFKIVGVEASTVDYVICLPGLEIEVAKECSGIRSSLSLFISSLLIGHFFLNTPISRGLLALIAVPVAIFKNAVRIVVLSLGAIYIDEGFLAGPLHRKGGILFFLLGLGVLASMTWLLRRHERLE